MRNENEYRSLIVFYRLLSIIIKHAGEEVAAIIDSSPKEIYPLLICLIILRGEIKVDCVIHGDMSVDEIFVLLTQTYDAFRPRFGSPDTTGLQLTHISKENWSVPPSTLTEVLKESDEFQRVADDFDGGAASIISVHRIDNTVWLIEYLNQKQLVDNRVGHNNTEKLLFHGCPYDAAEQILCHGFDHKRIGANGKILYLNDNV